MPGGNVTGFRCLGFDSVSPAAGSFWEFVFFVCMCSFFILDFGFKGSPKHRSL